MDFRQYDAAIGRFYNIDLLAEQATGISPYRFAYNNPIVFGDPSGLKEIQGEDPYIPPPTNPFTTGFNSYYGNTEHGFLWNLHNGGPFGQGNGNGGPAGYGLGTDYNGNYFQNGYEAITQYGSYGVPGPGYGQVTGYWKRIPGYNESVTGDNFEDGILIKTVKATTEWVGQNIEPYWQFFNSNVVSPLNGIAGIFEQGAKRSGITISTIQALEGRALAETLQAAKIVKIAARVSMVGNVSQLGYSAYAIIKDPKSAGNWTRLGVQVAFLGIETGLNAIVPGLGVAVGFGLNALEAAYGQELYDYMDKRFSNK